MGKRDTIRVSHLLFDFIGWVDYFENQHLPISEIEKLRMDLIHAVWNNDSHELKEFCTQVIRLQQYRYKLNGAAGVETREWIPKGLEHQFHAIPFNPGDPIKRLHKTFWNKYDPGIVLQDCMLPGDQFEKRLSIKFTEMTATQLIYFSGLIDSLEWFADSQTQFWFTYRPYLIPAQLERHFWFIDENYLGERDFVVKESRNKQIEKAF